MAKNLSKKTEQLVENVDEMSGVSFPNVDIPIVEKEEPIVSELLEYSKVAELSETGEIVNERVETEKEFLKRILLIQHIGGFGRHLDAMINERIKLLE